MSFFILLVIEMLCLFFKSTRMLGVSGLTLLFLLVPVAFITLFIFGCVFIYFNCFFKRRNLNVYTQPKLPDCRP